MSTRRKISFIFFAFLNFLGIGVAASEEDFSLFFSSSELEQLSSDKKSLASPVKKQKSLYLGALLYRSSHEWAIWVNENKITPQKSVPFIQVQAISPAWVSLIWVHEDALHKITFKPNQSYDPATKKIKEGK